MTSPRMNPTTFRTYTFTGVNAPVTVVGDSSRYRRVVLLARVNQVLITDQASELSTIGIVGAIPGGAFAVIPALGATPQWMVVVVAPGQKLYASAIAGSTLSVSVSDAVPDEWLNAKPIQTVTLTRVLPLLGATTGVSIPLVGSAPHPRRVLVGTDTGVAARILVSANPGGMHGVNIGDTFVIQRGAAPIPFLLAPGQSLYGAVADAAANASVVVSGVSGARRGTTGLPVGMGE